MIYEEDCGVLSYEDNGYGEQSSISACRGTEKDTGEGEYAYCGGERNSWLQMENEKTQTDQKSYCFFLFNRIFGAWQRTVLQSNHFQR